MLFLLGLLIGSGLGITVASFCFIGSEDHREVPAPGKGEHIEEAA